MNYLISGSRSLTNVPYIVALVQRIHTLGGVVLVGDADGVDSMVIDVSAELGVPCVVHHIGARPRNWNTAHGIVACPGNYIARDECMVRKADLVMCVWDGKSRGTAHVRDYALKLGKVTHIKTFTGR